MFEHARQALEGRGRKDSEELAHILAEGMLTYGKDMGEEEKLRIIKEIEMYSQQLAIREEESGEGEEEEEEEEQLFSSPIRHQNVETSKVFDRLKEILGEKAPSEEGKKEEEENKSGSAEKQRRKTEEEEELRVHSS